LRISINLSLFSTACSKHFTERATRGSSFVVTRSRSARPNICGSRFSFPPKNAQTDARTHRSSHWKFAEFPPRRVSDWGAKRPPHHKPSLRQQGKLSLFDDRFSRTLFRTFPCSIRAQRYMLADTEPVHICCNAQIITVYNSATIRQFHMTVGCLLKLHCPSLFPSILR
jgi:hypothetical protein